MGEVDMPAVVYYNRDRRRSSFTRPMRDPEEILEGLRSLKAAKGELSRTMSLTGDKRRGSREYKRFFASLSHHFARSSVRLFVCLCTSPFARHTYLRDSIFIMLLLLLYYYYYYYCNTFSLSLFYHHFLLCRLTSRRVTITRPTDIESH